MFWRKKPDATYALHDFQRLMHLSRKWTAEQACVVSEDDIYDQLLFFLAVYMWSLRFTKIGETEHLRFFQNACAEMAATFPAHSEEDIASSVQPIFQSIRPSSGGFECLAREYFQQILKVRKPGIGEGAFVAIVQSASVSILKKLKLDGYL